MHSDKFSSVKATGIITDDFVSGAEIITSITGFFPPALEVGVHARRQVGHTWARADKILVSSTTVHLVRHTAGCSRGEDI